MAEGSVGHDNPPVGNETWFRGPESSQTLRQRFFESEDYAQLREDMSKTSPDALQGDGRKHHYEGFIFEKMALDYFYTNVSPDAQNRNLAEFLQLILQNPKQSEVDFYKGQIKGIVPPELLTKKQKKLLDNDLLSNLRMLPGNETYRNPDAFIIDIQTDKQTGKKIARIVGVVDAKLGDAISVSQKRGIKESLTTLVNALKPHYRELVRALDIAGDLPEEIDINPPDKLTVKMIRPKDIRDRMERSGNLSQATSYFVPVTHQEVSDIYQSMVRDVANKV